MDLLGRDVTFSALAKSQHFVGARQELIAENIANVNTPHSKRRDLDARGFSRLLGQALGSGDRGAVLERLERSVAREVVEEQFFYRSDMGGVDIDREMSELAKANSLGAVIGGLMAKRIQMYKSVLRDGRV
jgi:flagellar basal-body rod protein FlgB